MQTTSPELQHCGGNVLQQVGKRAAATAITRISDTKDDESDCISAKLPMFPGQGGKG
jgi:hypothetical protein